MWDQEMHKKILNCLRDSAKRKCPEKRGTKELVSSTQQCTCTSSVGGQKEPFQSECDSF
jgi:hypothetical protein